MCIVQGKNGRQVEGWCGWLEHQGQEKHVLPLARKPAKSTRRDAYSGLDLSIYVIKSPIQLVRQSL
jgi:hypothetical protein